MGVDPATVRGIALGFDGVEEADHHGIPSFRVRGRIFCTLRAAEGRMMVKLEPEDQHNFSAAQPSAIAPVPGYWGRKGSTFVDLARSDAATVETLLKLAWSRFTPRNKRPMS